MHNASWVAMSKGVMGQMFPKALQIPHDVASQDFAPNVESIVALRPDVVVQWGDEGTEITAPLENAGLKVLGLRYGTQEDVQTWIALFATMLGKPERGQEMRRRIDDDLVTAAAEGRKRSNGPSILYFNRFTGGLKVAGHNTYNDFYIRMIGATNPATGDQGPPGNGMVGVDVEQVLAWDPQIVLLGNFDDAVPDDLYSAPVWQQLAAVRSRQVYKVPLGGYRWDPPGQESPLMWRWLSRIAFPQQGRSDLRSVMSSDYEFLYGQRPTEAQMDEVLWEKLNKGSAHYEQFDAA
jgi:iron complex transport system substrate-binding protein